MPPPKGEVAPSLEAPEGVRFPARPLGVEDAPPSPRSLRSLGTPPLGGSMGPHPNPLPAEPGEGVGALCRTANAGAAQVQGISQIGCSRMFSIEPSWAE